MTTRNPNEPNEGEGSKTADRHYREGVEKFLETEEPDELARKAARDIDEDPDAYRAAEEEGKRHVAEEDVEFHKR